MLSRRLGQLFLLTLLLVACGGTPEPPPAVPDAAPAPEMGREVDSVPAPVAVEEVVPAGEPAASVASGSGEQTVLLLPFRVECDAEGQRQLCFIAAIGDAGNFQPYAGEISGFDYAWGYTYALTTSGDTDALQLVAITEQTAEPGGIPIELTLTGGESRIVKTADGRYEFYGEKSFTCGETAACQRLGPLLEDPEAINFKFLTPPDPADPFLLLSWASASPVVQAEQVPQLAGKTWRLESQTLGPGEQQLIQDVATITADFALDDDLSGGIMSGSAGCNAYRATLNITGNTVNIDPFEIGDAQCDTPAQVMEQELAFLEALILAESFVVNGDRLQIGYNLGQGALSFVATP